MKLLIDNLDMAGPRDYTPWLRGDGPIVRRRLNQPDEFEAVMVSEPDGLVMPLAGARVRLVRRDGTVLFTGYLSQPPQASCVGETERGPWCTYNLRAIGDEHLLDRRPLPPRPDYVAAGGGELLQDLAQELCPNVFDYSGIGDVGTLADLTCGGTRYWSGIAHEVASQTRSAYRVGDHAITLAPVGNKVHVLDEKDRSVDSRALTFALNGTVVNRATVLGANEPGSYVKDQFSGDGYELSFPLSNLPYMRTPHTVLEEEFREELASYMWELRNATRALEVSHGQLASTGGNGTPNESYVALQQNVELGGAWQFQHGEWSISRGNGWIGGLFKDAIETAGAVAAFRILDSDGLKKIQPVVNGALAGTAITVRDGCRYALSARTFATEPFRLHPRFPSRTGSHQVDVTSSDLRIVLDCREIDPSNPARLAQPATVLFDDVVRDVPAVARYVLMASEDLYAATNYARIRRMPEVLVRSAVPGQPYRTRLVGGLAEGAECGISSTGTLYFYSANPPEPNEAIAVTYRTMTRAAGSAIDEQSVSGHARLGDDGLRSCVATIAAPRARTSEDCARAASTWLENSSEGGWSGAYECWSETLASGASIFPGEAVLVMAASRSASFPAIVREVQIQIADVTGERERIKIHFADEGAEPIGLQLEREQPGLEWPRVIIDASAPPALAPLGAAEFTSITSTTLTIDAGLDPPVGGGIEVRRSDSGWAPDIDRNLAGRFSSRTFTLPRLARNQQYCLRQYDASTPPRYSRHTTVLYVDKPL